MNSNPVIFVEIGGSHDECLLTQLHAIRKHGRDVILICNANIKHRNPEFAQYVSEFHIVDLSQGKLQNAREVKHIWQIIKNSGSQTVVINTAQGNKIRSLCLYAIFSKVEFIGIVHTTRKFKHSITQKIISLKIKKYLLLSQHLLSTIKPPKRLSIDYFYPIHFPQSNSTIDKKTPIVTIIGGVEGRRSDLPGFLDMLLATERLNVTFVFLGGTNQYDKETIAFKESIKSHNLTNKIVMFDDYIPQDLFNAYLKITDLILPLIHPHSPSGKQYFKNQISGAMSISFAYKIPLLLHQEYKHITEMQVSSFYYTEGNFTNALEESLINSKAKSMDMDRFPDYNTEYQEDKYFKFIFPDDKSIEITPTPIVHENESEYDVSVILINYNSSVHTLNCIKSLLEKTSSSINYQIVVIDNASENDDYRKLVSGYNKLDNSRHIEIFRSKINLGFSGGNMLGIQFSSADYYFILNNDCVVQNDCIGILYDFCEKNSQVALCSPQLINADGNPQPCINYFPSLKTKIFGSGVLNLSYGEKHTSRKAIHKQPVQVDVVSGSQMFVRGKDFFNIGGLDTTFFLYCEEEDLALRLYNAGYKTFLVPQARNYHVGSASTNKSLAIKKEFYISFLYFYRKHYGFIRTTLIKIILCLRLIRKSLKDKDNLKLFFFVATGAHLKHSLRHNQKIVPETPIEISR